VWARLAFDGSGDATVLDRSHPEVAVLARSGGVYTLGVPRGAHYQPAGPVSLLGAASPFPKFSEPDVANGTIKTTFIDASTPPTSTTGTLLLMGFTGAPFPPATAVELQPSGAFSASIAAAGALTVSSITLDGSATRVMLAAIAKGTTPAAPIPTATFDGVSMNRVSDALTQQAASDVRVTLFDLPNLPAAGAGKQAVITWGGTQSSLAAAVIPLRGPRDTPPRAAFSGQSTAGGTAFSALGTERDHYLIAAVGGAFSGASNAVTSTAPARTLFSAAALGAGSPNSVNLHVQISRHVGATPYVTAANAASPWVRFAWAGCSLTEKGP
jgi:hypothetical protein